ncbi:hypothetical protein HMPREF0972_00461 [Actinomyces sp. oral taxon 848 str. F0332]|nr:hypothetical protein HMPREF0972_00461 [Actinomyces sp. oral taxon 848 str. F0332]
MFNPKLHYRPSFFESLKDIPNSTLRENGLAVVHIRLVAQSKTDRSLY